MNERVFSGKGYKENWYKDRKVWFYPIFTENIISFGSTPPLHPVGFIHSPKEI
jgi:hypothetical protein